MIDVTCAIIRNEDDKILVVRRGEKTDHPFKWEFPGGKIMPGEQEDDCIIREIREELSMEIIICKRLEDVVHDYGHKKIRLIPFVCDTLNDIPFLSEHIGYKWTDISELSSVDFSEADVFVAENYIKLYEPQKIPCGQKTESAYIPEPGDEEIREMVEKLMGTKQADWIATSVIENPSLLRKLIDFSYSNDRKIAFHSSWILTKAFDKSPVIFDSYLDLLTESLRKIDNQSAIRSFMRIISLTDPGKIRPGLHGSLADLCFSFLNSRSSSIAIKAYSMEILYRLTLIYPELASELALSVTKVTEDNDSAGIKARARSILKKIDK